MRFSYRAVCVSAAVVAAAGLVASAIAATPSAAAAGKDSVLPPPTWSVSYTGRVGDISVTSWKVTDGATHATITCEPLPTLLLHQGMRLHSKIAIMESLGFPNGCTLPDGTVIQLTAHRLPWPMVAVSYDLDDNMGVTAGHFSGIEIILSSSGCSGILDGTAALAHDGTQKFQVYNNPDFLIFRNGGNLHVYNVTGCNGVFNNGDVITMSYTEAINPNDGIGTPVFITSP